MADKKGVQITESFARRLAKLLRWGERKMQPAPTKRRRLDKANGYVAILRYKLTEDLTQGSNATATLTTQNSSTGAWTDGTSPDDDEEIYDGVLQTGYKIASGQIVYVYRNPASGLLNLLQTINCPELA